MRDQSLLRVPALVLIFGAAAAASHFQPPADAASPQRQLATDSAAAFAPTKVRLTAAGVPLAAVVQDLSRQAGVQLDLAREPADLPERPVSLDTGETTFWEALDALCRQAKVSLQPSEFDPALLSSSAGMLSLRGAEEVLVLQEGVLPACPAAYLAAVRVRLLQERWANRGRGPADEHRWMLEVLSEPRVIWQRPPTFRFEPAGELTVNPTPQTPPRSLPIYRVGLDRSKSALRPVLRHELAAYVRTRPAADRAVPEMKGVLIGTVQLGDYVTVTVAELPNTGEATAAAADGTKLKVSGFKTNALGVLTLKAEVERPATSHSGHDGGNSWGGDGNPVARSVSTLSAYGRDGESFRLFNARDRPCRVALRVNEARQEKGITTVKYTLDAEPADPDAQPRRLELDVPRRAAVEAKFTLHEVPRP